MKNVRIITIVTTKWDQNTYLVINEDTSEGVLIDSGDNEKEIIQAIEENKVNVKGILLTHYHFDHVASVSNIANKYNIKAYIHENDYDYLTDKNKFNIAREAENITILNEYINTFNDDINIANLDFKIKNLQGHTKGSVLFFINNFVFTGDVLFPESVGRSDLLGGNPRDMIKSIYWINENIDDNIIIYPGHGKKEIFKEVSLINQYLFKRKNRN